MAKKAEVPQDGANTETPLTAEVPQDGANTETPLTAEVPQDGANTETPLTFEDQTGQDLQFESVDLGNFEFYQFKNPGDTFTGKLIGIFYDTVKNPKKDEAMAGTQPIDKVLSFRREKFLCGILMEDWQTKTTYLLPTYWQLQNYFEGEASHGVNFNQYVYRIEFVKKAGEGKQTDPLIFKVGRAKLG